MHLFLPKPEVISKSTELVSASHATSHGCLVTLAVFSTASKMASFLGVHPSVCHRSAQDLKPRPNLAVSGDGEKVG